MGPELEMIPANLRDEAKLEAQLRDTTVNASGTRKAKARIVIIGFEHPDLGDPEYKTAAPVMSALGRNMCLQTSVQEEWDVEGLDMTTAFLQVVGDAAAGSGPVEKERLWTSGVPELVTALGGTHGDLLRILRNVYGLTTAPRALWKDVTDTCMKLGAHRVLGDRCIFAWFQPNPRPRNDADRFTLIGYVGANVDDFERSGDRSNPEWSKIRGQLDEAYKWGAQRTGNFRFTGLDVTQYENKEIELDQDFYIRDLEEPDYDKARLAMPKLELTTGEKTMTRGLLGALLWPAVQSQPLISARVGLLLSQLGGEGETAPTMRVAVDAIAVLRDLRKHPTKLRFHKFASARH